MKKTTLFIIVFGCVLFSFLTCPSQSWATYTSTSPNLPQGQYGSQSGFQSMYPQGIWIANVSHDHFTESFPPPPPGMNDMHTFPSQIDGLVSFNGVDYSPFSTPASVTVFIASGIDSGNIRNFNTEMLALDASLGGGVMIRESPTLASIGQTSITDNGDGTYQISSFFDVFTELTIDGGITWYPDQNGPARMTLIPEPATICLLGLGGILLRRRK